jgi:hypothetical protein
MLATSVLGALALSSSGVQTATDLGPELIFGAAAGPRSMVAHKMADFAASDGAVCLDGTPGMFFFAPAANDADTANWEIYFQGGGWCYEEQDCWNRAKGNIGSSKGYQDGKSTSDIGGLMSSDCTVNPDFCNVNRVHILYCDGNSFSGNRDAPVVVNGQPIYFRGKRIIDAVVKTLVRDHGLGKAENVLLTGCSAGGLSTFLHADYVGELVKAAAPNTLKKYKAAPISGFFLLHDTVEGKPVYADEMKYIFNLANSSGPGSMNDACLASKSDDDKWRCNFAEESYAHITSPIFPLNSALDSWQTGCIYTAEPVPHNSTANGQCSSAPGWHDCAGDPEKCNSAQMATMNQYEVDFMSKMKAAGPTYAAKGNGAFIHSCHTHCEAQSGAFNTFKVNGVSIQQAVSKWWAGDGDDAAQNYEPCQYHTDSTPHKCNPTC